MAVVVQSRVVVFSSLSRLPAGHPWEDAGPTKAPAFIVVGFLLFFLLPFRLVPERAQPGRARVRVAQRRLEPRYGPVVGVHALGVDAEGRKARGAALARERVAGLERVPVVFFLCFLCCCCCCCCEKETWISF